MEKCYFCDGEILKNQRVKVDLWWGDDLVIFENVPANVCPQCGEKYFDSDVSKEMKKIAKNKSNAIRHLTVPVMKFKEGELLAV